MAQIAHLLAPPATTITVQPVLKLVVAAERLWRYFGEVDSLTTPPHHCDADQECAMGIKYNQFMVNAFMDLAQLKPEARRYSEMIDALGGNLLPAQANEQTEGGILKRMAFSSQDHKKILGFLSNNFQYMSISESPVEDLGDSYSHFVEEACPLFEKGMQHLNKQSQRLSALVKLFIECDQNNFKGLAQKLFKLPPAFASQLPFEWVWRCVSRSPRSFAGTNEIVNYLCTSSTQVGQITKGLKEIEEYDFAGILIELEFNTLAENDKYRFDANITNAFFRESIQWFQDFENEILNFAGLER